MTYTGDVPIQPDPVIEAYKKHIDRTLIRENLKLSVTERFACGRPKDLESLAELEAIREERSRG